MTTLMASIQQITVYLITCVGEGEPWTVAKRFSDCDALRERLLACAVAGVADVPFPARGTQHTTLHLSHPSVCELAGGATWLACIQGSGDPSTPVSVNREDHRQADGGVHAGLWGSGLRQAVVDDRQEALQAWLNALLDLGTSNFLVSGRRTPLHSQAFIIVMALFALLLRAKAPLMQVLDFLRDDGVRKIGLGSIKY
eukprot:SAG11_NODE_128_length_15542_cov_6.432105_13_plen_198_part_00